MDNQIVVNELLNQVERLNINEFEAFFGKIQQLYVQKTTRNWVIEEQRLIKQINNGLSMTKQMRFEYLIARRDVQMITPTELNELIDLTHIVEKNDVLRFKRLARLAQLKQMSLPEVLSFYSIKPIPHG